ncbi:hypothetical protein GCM10010497_49790 [Streptomyces cinereoruber]|uniref:Uncharacterized protein n=1 Tax=Streptomyces cinereoruber TaxID=67260 RepID=A0AAV4KQP3_9ACTN|nr:hypothetical protein GCM10010497_49790 [Streptomyces cinereoruber]
MPDVVGGRRPGGSVRVCGGPVPGEGGRASDGRASSGRTSGGRAPAQRLPYGRTSPSRVPSRSVILVSSSAVVSNVLSGSVMDRSCGPLVACPLRGGHGCFP